MGNHEAKSKYIFQIGPLGNGGVNSVIESILQSPMAEKYSFYRIIVTKENSSNIAKCTQFVRAFMQCLRMRREIALAHVHMASKGSYYRKAILIAFFHSRHIPVMIHLHGACFREFYHGVRPFIQKMIRKTFGKADCVIVLAKDWLPFCEEIGVLEKTEIVSNFTCVPAEIIKRSPEKKTCTFLLLGRMGKRKGCYDLVDAIYLLRKENKDKGLQVALAGDGEVEKMKEYVNQKGVADIIQVLGWVSGEARIDLLKACDVLVLPSYAESFGLSLIEGMAYGMPVVASLAGSIPNVVDDGVDGFLVEAGNIEKLAEKIDYMNKNVDRRLQLGENARQHVLRSYSDKVFCEKMCMIYDKLLRLDTRDEQA